jgi:3-oxoacyl-[acyl-carrier protein] reductase
MGMDGKVVLVTGASRGIGRAIAIECSRQGATVAINYSLSGAQAEQVVQEIELVGGRAGTFKADVGEVGQIEELFDLVIERFGGVDILVNNAGMMINRPVAEVSEAEFDQVFRVNVKGLFFCCQQAARKMRHGGKIINIGTSVTRVMLPNYGTYAASKGSVEQLTRVLAKELGSKGITVNTISPGPTSTELFHQGKSPEQINTLASMSAFGRIGEPEDIGRAVALLCSESGNWISGQTIFVNGAFIG